MKKESGTKYNRIALNECSSWSEIDLYQALNSRGNSSIRKKLVSILASHQSKVSMCFSIQVCLEKSKIQVFPISRLKANSQWWN